MRRGELISPRRHDVEIEGEVMIVSGQVEGGIIRTGKSATRGAGCAVPLPAGEPTSLPAQGCLRKVALSRKSLLQWFANV